MKKSIAPLFFFILFSVNAIAVTTYCGDSFVNNCVLNESLILRRANYFIGDTDPGVIEGAIRVNHTTNLYLDCNGSTLIGANTTSGMGIRVTRDNFRLYNCTLKDYYIAYRDFGFVDTTLDDVVFNRTILAGLDTFGRCVANNLTFYNSSIILENTAHNTIINNSVLYDTETTYAIDIFSGDNNTFDNVDVINSRHAYRFIESNYTKILNSNIYNTTEYYSVGVFNSTNIVIENNIVNLSARGIYADLGGRNLTINNNRIDNLSVMFDGWLVGIDIYTNWTNVYITNNFITNYGKVGVVLRGKYNATVSGNYFHEMPQVDKFTHNVGTFNEVPCSVHASPLLNGYLALPQAIELGIHLENKSKIMEYSMINIGVSSNTYANTVQCFGKFTSRNYTHDFSNFWNVSYELTYMNRTNLYLSNNFDTIRGVKATVGVCNYNTQYDEIFRFVHWAGCGDTRVNFNYTLKDTVFKLINVNVSHNKNISIFEMGAVNDVFNGSIGTTQSSDTNRVNLSIISNRTSFILYYAASNQPRPTEIDITITDIGYDYGDILTYNCTGSGQTNWTNMARLYGGSGFYIHRIDGGDNEVANTNTYLQTSCSLHTYTPLSQVPLSVTSSVSKQILNILLIFIAVALIAVFIWPILNNDTNINKWLVFVVIALIALFLLTELIQIVAVI